MPNTVNDQYDYNKFVGLYRKKLLDEDPTRYSGLPDEVVFNIAARRNPYLLEKKWYLSKDPKAVGTPYLKQFTYNIKTIGSAIPDWLSQIGAFVTQRPANVGVLDEAGNIKVSDFEKSVRESALNLRENVSIWRNEYLNELQKDPEIAALIRWNADEPVKFRRTGAAWYDPTAFFTGDANWYHSDIAARSFISALPSLLTMSAASIVTGGSSLAVLAGTFLLESSNNGADMYRTAREQGLSKEDATNVAAVGSIIYGGLSALEETLSFEYFLKWTGLKNLSKKALLKNITNGLTKDVVKAGGFKAFMASVGKKTGGALSQGLVEGLQEYTQYMTEQVVNWSMLNKYGAYPDEAMKNLGDVIDAKYWDDEARMSLHAGLVSGLGFGFAGATIGTPVEYSRRKKLDNWISSLKTELDRVKAGDIERKNVAKVVTNILEQKGDINNILALYKDINSKGRDGKQGQGGSGGIRATGESPGEKMFNALTNPSTRLEIVDNIKELEATDEEAAKKVLKDIEIAAFKKGMRNIEVNSIDDLVKIIDSYDAAEALSNVKSDPGYSDYVPEFNPYYSEETPVYEPDIELPQEELDAMEAEAVLDYDIEPDLDYVETLRQKREDVSELEFKPVQSTQEKDEIIKKQAKETYQVQIGSINAKVNVKNGKIDGAAPILKKFIGQSVEDLQKWVDLKAGKIVKIVSQEQLPEQTIEQNKITVSNISKLSNAEKAKVIIQAQSEIDELSKIDGVKIERAPTKKGYENRIGTISISSELQKQGIGTKIVNAFKRLKEAQGRKFIEVEANPGSEGFWEKQGFVKYGDRSITINGKKTKISLMRFEFKPAEQVAKLTDALKETAYEAGLKYKNITKESTIGTVLKDINTPIASYLNNVLNDYTKSTKVYFADKVIVNGKEMAGSYVYGLDHGVFLNNNVSQKKQVETFLHEISHIITEGAFSNATPTNKELAFRHKISSLRITAMKNIKKNYYYFKSDNEFVAGAITNSSFLDELSKVNDEDGKNISESVLLAVKNLVTTTSKSLKGEGKQTSVEQKTKEARNVIGDISNLDVNFQIEGQSKQPLISEEPELAVKIETRLKEQYPFVNTEKVRGVIETDGVESVGVAIGNTVKWSTTDGRVDTAPHEYFHVIANSISDQSIVKMAVERFGSMEKLTQYVGEYYANRIQDKKAKNWLSQWLKQFWLKVKTLFGDKDAATQVLAENFFKGKYSKLETKISTTNDVEIVYQRTEQVTNDDGIEEDGLGVENTADGTVYLDNYFSNIFNSYVTPTQHSELVNIAKKNTNYDSFKAEYIDYINKNFPNAKYLENSTQFVNKTKEFFVKQRYKIPVAKKIGNEGRLYLNLVFDAIGWNKVVNPRLSVNDGTELATGRKLPDTKSTNFIEDRGFTNVIYLLAKDIVKYNKKRDFYRKASIEFSSAFIKKLDRMFLDSYDGNNSLLFFLGSTGKAGDSKLIISGVPKDVLNMTKDEIVQNLKSEIGKTITEEHYKNFINDGEVIESYNPKVWNQIYGKHQVMKKIKGLDYLMREKSVQDTFNRLRISLTEGFVPIGSGPEFIMLINADDVIVKVRDKNVSYEVGEYNLFDGWKITGSKRMFDIQEAIGRTPETDDGTELSVIKTAQEYLSDDLKDYIGVKMLDMTPLLGMEFYKKGENTPFARVAEYEDGRTYFQHLDKNGKVIGEFDSLISTNEAKQVSGKFTDFYKIHMLPENATKVIITPGEKAKTNPSHPLAWWEQVWSPKINQDLFKTAKRAVMKHINIVTKKYMDKILEANDLPSVLRDLIYREPVEGKLPTELQYITGLVKDGEGLINRQYLVQILPYLANSFIIDGMFKLRNPGNGTKLYLKPMVDISLKPKEFAVSIDNVAAVNAVLKKMGLNRNSDWNIDSLNNWLKYNNFEVLLSKPPIEKASAVGVYKLKGFVERGHGDVIFLHNDDVKGPLQADFDGDSANIEIFSDKGFANAIKALINSDEFRSRDRSSSGDLDIYPDVMEGTSSSSRDDVARIMANNARSDGALAQIIIAKMVSNKLFMKDFSVVIDGKKYTVRDPNEIVSIPLRLDKKGLTEEKFNKFNVEGDFIIRGDGSKIETYQDFLNEDEAYLATTFENSLSIYLQMAADNPKHGFLGAIGYNKTFILRKMFKVDGENIEGFDKPTAIALSAIVSTFNDSNFKNGRMDGRQMTFQEIFHKSYELNNLLSLPAKEQGKMIRDIIIRKYPYLNSSIEEISVNGKVGVTEHLLKQPAVQMERYNKRLDAELDKYYSKIKKDEAGNIIESEEHKKLRTRAIIKNIIRSKIVPLIIAESKFERNAHYNVIDKIVKNMSRDGIIIGDANIDGFTKEEVRNAYNFANKVGNEFYKIYSNETQFIKDEDNKYVTYEYNESFQKFVEKYYDEFKSMSKNERSLASLFFLTGIKREGERFRIKNVGRILPFQLMDGGVLKGYLKLWHNELTQNMNEIKPSEHVANVSKLFENLKESCK